MQTQKNWQQAAGNELAGPDGGKKVALFRVLSNGNGGVRACCSHSTAAPRLRLDPINIGEFRFYGKKLFIAPPRATFDVNSNHSRANSVPSRDPAFIRGRYHASPSIRRVPGSGTGGQGGGGTGGQGGGGAGNRGRGGEGDGGTGGQGDRGHDILPSGQGSAENNSLMTPMNEQITMASEKKKAVDQSSYAKRLCQNTETA